MPRVRVKDLLESGESGQIYKISGWIRSKRGSKNVSFLALSDGSCQETLQAVCESGDFDHTLKDVTTGAAVELQGTLTESPAKGQKWDLLVKDLKVLGGADSETYPLQKKGHSLEFLREIAHLRARTNTFGAVFRLRNVLANAVHKFFQERGFVWAQTPIITASDCEGAGEMFQVTSLDLDNLKGKVDYSRDFFGKQSHLTVSGQLEAESLALALGNVYTFGPTFRAENSNTTRHLAEFWMVEPEVAFADLGEVATLAEDFLKFCIKEALDKCSGEIAFFEKFYKNQSRKNLEAIVNSNFVRMTYSSAIEELASAKKSFQFKPEWGADLQTEHERYLAEEVAKGPLVVTDYPKDIKAFYMRQNSDQKTVAAMDVLVPGVGELMGGSQREERLDHLISRVEEMNLPKEELDWYLDLRRYGTAPHSGFGLGFERLVMYVSGMQNIRDVVISPRAPQTIHF